MLSKLKALLIKTLGGITKEEKARSMQACEDFANKYLVAKSEYVQISGYVDSILTDKECFISESYTCINNSVCPSINIAPWCSNTAIIGVYFPSKEEEQSK